MKSKLLSLFAVYVGSGLSFITTILLAKILPTEEFAIIILAIATGAFSSLLVNLGSERILIRDLYKAGTCNQNQVIHINFSRRTLLLILLTCSFALFVLRSTGSPNDTISFFLLLVWAALRGFSPNSWFDFIGRILFQNTIMLIEKFTVLCVLLFYFSGLGVESAGLFWISVLLFSSRLVSTLTQYILWWRLSENTFQFNTKSLGLVGISGTSAHVTLGLMLNAIAGYGTQLLLSVYGSNDERASYGLAFQIVAMILLFQGVTLRYLMKSMSRRLFDDTVSFKLAVRHSAMMGLGSLFLAAISWFIMLLAGEFLGGAYTSITQYAALLYLWVILVGVTMPYAQFIITNGKERWYFLVTLLGAAVSVFLGLIYIPSYGASSLAYILLTTRVVTLVAHVSMCRRIG